MYKFLLLILVFTTGFSETILAQECDTINWDEHRKLSWKDFKATPDTVVPFIAAETNGLLHYTGKYENNLLIISAYSSFITCKSWTKDDTDTTLLKHEQTHFDIWEYCRRLFIRQLMTQTFHLSNIESEVKDIFNKIQNVQYELSQQYDLETGHSRNNFNQTLWTNDIFNKIEQLKKYNKTAVVLLCK